MTVAVVILAAGMVAMSGAAVAAWIRNGGLREQVAVAAAQVSAANSQADELGEMLLLERQHRDRMVAGLQSELREAQAMIDACVEPGKVRERLSEMLKRAAAR